MLEGSGREALVSASQCPVLQSAWRLYLSLLEVAEIGSPTAIERDRAGNPFRVGCRKSLQGGISSRRAAPPQLHGTLGHLAGCKDATTNVDVVRLDPSRRHAPRY